MALQTHPQVQQPGAAFYTAFPTAEPGFLLRSCMDDFRELRARYRQPLHCAGCKPACGECRAAPGRLVSVAGSAARNLPGVAQQGTSMLSWPCRLLARGSGARGSPLSSWGSPGTPRLRCPPPCGCRTSAPCDARSDLGVPLTKRHVLKLCPAHP